MWIKNRERLATSPERTVVLDVVNAAFDAIDTEQIVQKEITVKNGLLSVRDQDFDLKNFDHVYVMAIGKGAARATTTLHAILEPHITHAIVLDKVPLIYDGIESYQGTHPIPSHMNLRASSSIYELAKRLGERDLALVVVCGGGSALACWPESECEQGVRLYKSFLHSGGDIDELNVIRKHISLLKGGGLAKALYPATVIGLIFSDVPDDISEVASGPTYLDKTTVENALAMLRKLRIKEEFELNETPKEKKYFEKVSNIEMISNRLAIQAMFQKANELGIRTATPFDPVYEYASETLRRLRNGLDNAQLVIAGGEIRMDIKGEGGHGGRCQYLGLEAILSLPENMMLVAFASDGEDNSDVCGVIVDHETKKRATATGIDIRKQLEAYESYSIFEKTGDQIITGQTGANVSDIYMLYKLS